MQVFGPLQLFGPLLVAIVLAVIGLVAVGVAGLFGACLAGSWRQKAAPHPATGQLRSPVREPPIPAGLTPQSRAPTMPSTLDLSGDENAVTICGDAVTLCWRLGRLRKSGLQIEQALELAESDVDVHQLVALVDHGCPPRLAARILAPLTATTRHPAE